MKKLTKLSIEIDGQTIDLSVHTEGRGRSILCLHGLMHSSEIWDRVSGRLVNDFQIITIDLPGFGASPALPVKNITLPNYGRIIGTAINALSFQHEISAIVADSLSTNIVAFACEHGYCSTQTPMLLSGCPFDGIPLLLRVLPVSLLLKPGLVILGTLPVALSRPLINLFARYTVYRWVAGANEISTGVLQSDPTTAQKLFVALKEPTPRETISSLVQCRCVLLRGKFDRVVSHSNLSRWADTIGATYLELPESGHTPALEQPEQYVQAIRGLLAETTGN